MDPMGNQKLRIPLAVFVAVFATTMLVLFMPLPRLDIGPRYFEMLGADEKHDVVERTGKRMADFLVKDRDVNLTRIDVDIENKTLLILLKEKYRYKTSDWDVRAIFRKFNEDLCGEMRSTDIYKAGFKITIEFEKLNGNHRDSLIVSKAYCSA